MNPRLEWPELAFEAVGTLVRAQHHEHQRQFKPPEIRRLERLGAPLALKIRIQDSAPTRNAVKHFL